MVGPDGEQLDPTGMLSQWEGLASNDQRRPTTTVAAVITADPVLNTGAGVDPDDPRGTKRRRPGSPELPGDIDGGIHAAAHDGEKRARQQCFKCGGEGHIAVMCPSRHGAAEDPAGIKCHGCSGTGHFLKQCPSKLQRDQCWKCYELGHRGRECPVGAQAAMQQTYRMAAPYMMQGSGYPPGPYGRAPMAPMAMPGMRPPGPVPGTGRCFRCNEPGHWTRDCPQRPIGDGDRDGCFKCGRAGHRARDCDVCYKCLQSGHKAVQCTNAP